LAVGFLGVVGFFEFGFALADGEDVGRHGGGSGVGDEVESLGEECAEHKLEVVFGCGRWGFGDDLEAIGFKPDGAALDAGGIEAVGGGDEIEHGGLVVDVAVAAEIAAFGEGEFARWAGVDVGDLEGRGGRFGCGLRCGWGLGLGWGLGEYWGGEKGGKSQTGKRSLHVANLCGVRTDGFWALVKLRQPGAVFGSYSVFRDGRGGAAVVIRLRGDFASQCLFVSQCLMD
jgi:hypothetical protein